MNARMARFGVLFTAFFLIYAGAVAVTQGNAALPQAGNLSPVEELGKALFFDNISQPSRAMSCATCHSPDVGWTGKIAGNNVHGSV